MENFLLLKIIITLAFLLFFSPFVTERMQRKPTHGIAEHEILILNFNSKAIVILMGTSSWMSHYLGFPP